MTTNAPAMRRITGAALGLLLLGSTAAWSAATQSGGTSLPEATVVQVAASGVDGAFYDDVPAVGSEESIGNMDECELVDGLSGM